MSFIGPLALALLPQAVPDAPTRFLERTLAAYEALDAGDLDRARPLFAANLERFPEHANSAYALACIAARSGDTDTALDWLTKAVEFGYADADVAAWDADLAPLRSDPRFDVLVVRMRATPSRAPSNARLVWSVSDRWPHFSSDGTRLATCGGGEFAILDARTNEIVAVDQEARIDGIGFSPYGSWLEVSRRGGAKAFWDAFEGRHLPGFDRGTFWGVYPGSEGLAREWTSPDGARVLRFERRAGPSTIGVLLDRRSGKELANFGDVGVPVSEGGFGDHGRFGWWMNAARQRLHVFDAASGRTLRTLEPTSGTFLHALADPNSAQIVTSERGLGLTRWDLETGDVVRRTRSTLDATRSTDVPSPDGRYFLTYQSETAFEVRDVLTFDLLWTLDTRRLDRWTHGATFRPDGVELALAAGGRVTIHESSSGRVLRTLGSPALDFAPPALSADGTRMLVPCEDGELRVIELASSRCLATWKLHAGPIDVCAFLADGERLLVGWRDGTLAILDGRTGAVSMKVERALEGAWSDAIASADGQRVIARTQGGDALLLDSESGAELAKLGPAGRGSVQVIHDASRTIAAAQAGGVVAFFDLDSGARRVRELRTEDKICSLAFSPDGAALACGTVDKGLFVWRVEDGALLRNCRAPDMFDESLDIRALAFEPDGRRLVYTTGNYGTVRRLDVASGAESMLHDSGGGNGGTLRARSSSSGKRLYVHGMGAGEQPVLDSKSGRPLLDLHGERLGFVDGTRDDRWVVGTVEHAVRVFGEELDARYTYIPFDDGGWIAKSESLHCAGTAAALRWAVVVVGDETYPFASFASELLDPKRVRAAAAGVKVRPAKLGEPPKVRVVGDAIRALDAGADSVRAEFEFSAPLGIAGAELDFDGEALDGVGELFAALGKAEEPLTVAFQRARRARAQDSELRLVLYDRAGVGSRPVRVRFVTAK